MTKHGSNSEIGSLYARWAREEADKRRQSDRLKEFFADAKDQGFNPKAMRAAFKEQYRLENETFGERDKREAADAVVDEYLASLARVRARENIEEFDPETGEITEPAASASEPNPAADAPIVGAGGSADPLGTAATIPRSVEAHDGSEDTTEPGQPAEDDTAPTDADADASGDNGNGGLANAGGDHVTGAIPHTVERAPKLNSSAVGAGGDEPRAVPSTSKRQWKHSDPPHPDCLNPDPPNGCGGFSNMGLCQRCKEAAAMGHAA